MPNKKYTASALESMDSLHVLLACTESLVAQSLPTQVEPAESFYATHHDRLIDSGFAPAVRDEETVLRKTMPVWDMPYAREHMVDGVHIFDNDQAVIEVATDGLVKLSIGDGRYDEEPVSGETPEGFGVLIDAGMVFKPEPSLRHAPTRKP